MKVCTCCYDPMIQDKGPFSGMFGAMLDSFVIVPDGTPVIEHGSWGVPSISGEVLKKAGLQWQDGRWCKPDGSEIEGLYDLTAEGGVHLEEWEKELKNDKDKVIPFLKSSPKDDSTLGSGDHAKRQAKVLLPLFDEYVLGGYDEEIDNRNYSSEHFGGPYPVLNFKTGMLGSHSDESESNDDSLMGHMGYDIKNLKRLRQEIDADSMKLAELNISATDGSETAKQYCYKLRRGLAENLHMLNMAAGATSDFYGMMDNPGMALNPMGMLLGTFMARHNTECMDWGVNALYRVMLPILMPKLKEAGYPDSDEVLRWDYGEPRKNKGLAVVGALASQFGASISHGIGTKRTLACKVCGHEVEVEIYQELDVDGETPKGDPEVRDLPDACPKCGNTIKKTE